ncbi:LysR family transcriptional regulator [Lactiplantibacillus paraxiangfangensis]|uniref:LysR family transcriptional regulator n=1 Tax=Lactiplantibacillus paraxiangfangensis TaxID=3076224 RepID=UPI0030C732F9
MFKKINLFIDVIELGSFQKAAQRNFISQRAVSQSVNQLENELGFKLFTRGKNKISVTHAGHEFYLKSRDLVNNFNTSIDNIQKQQQNQYQDLKIGYFSPFESTLLANQILKIKREHVMKVNLIVSEESVEHLISDTIAGLLDMAYIIDYGHIDDLLGDTLTKHTVYQNQIKIGISQMNPYASCDALPIDVLTEYPILYYSPEESDYIRNGFASTLPLSNNAITTKRIASIEQMQLLVATDTAIAHYPGGLTAVPLADKINFKSLKNQTSNYRIQAIFQKDGPKIGLIHQYLASFKQRNLIS